jgi:hypothetical protein
MVVGRILTAVGLASDTLPFRLKGDENVYNAPSHTCRRQ